MSTIPKPESEGRAACRVEGCAGAVVALTMIETTIRVFSHEELTRAQTEISSSVASFNHGFCESHLRVIPPAFLRRWAACQNQAALERAWQTIAADIAIEELKR